MFVRQAGTEPDEFSMDVMDGIRRPEIKRQMLGEVEALEKNHYRSAARRCSNSNDNDDFTLDIRDGISRPEVKRQAMEAINSDEMGNDFGMFKQPRFISHRRHSLKTSILVEEAIAGAVMKRSAQSFESLSNLFEGTLLERLDGTKVKRCTTKADMLRDDAYASARQSAEIVLNVATDFGMFNVAKDGVPPSKYAIVIEEKIAGVLHARHKSSDPQSGHHAPKSIRQIYHETALDNLDGLL